MKKVRTLNQEKREAIITSAIEEFYKKGYEGSSMDSISQSASVSKATVYNHFKNKEDLFFALGDILKARFNKAFKYEFNEDLSIETQLTQIAKKEMDFLKNAENIKLIQIMTIVMIQKNNMGLKLIQNAQDECLLMTSTWFSEAKKRGVLKFDSSDFVSTQFIGMIKSFAFYPQLYGAPILSENEENIVIEKAVDMIIKLYGVK